MTMLPAAETIAKPEVTAAINAVSSTMTALFAALPEGFGQREQIAILVLQEGGRLTLQAELQRIEDALPSFIAVGDAQLVHGEHQPGTGEYHSLFGKLETSRRTFREVGVRNGPTVVALELVAGLAEGATPAFAHNIVQGYGMHDMRRHLLLLDAAGRHAPPRATVERLAVRLAERVVEHLPKVEPLVRAAEQVPDGARAIALGLDRTSAPMAEPRAEGASKKPRRKRTKPRVRATPKPIDVNFRMAYVGTVSFLDEHGETLGVRRYAGTPCDPPEALCARMAEDVRCAMRQSPMLTVEVIQEGCKSRFTAASNVISALRGSTGRSS